MDDSILNTIKKMLGYPVDMTEFDIDIMANINAAFSVLTQLGVGPSTGFKISDENSKFSDFIEDQASLNLISMYLFAKTKLGFDPPAQTALIEVYKKIIEEYEFRLQVSNDTSDKEG